MGEQFSEILRYRGLLGMLVWRDIRVRYKQSLLGVAWAFLQPYRITLLHPHGQGFWWLVIEPPLLVVLVGIVFALFVAPGLIEDLEEVER